MFVNGLGATPQPAAKPAAPLPGGLASGVVFGGRPQWVAFVKAHGGTVAHIPRGALKGELAANYGGRFVLAPLDIRKQERATIAAERADVAAGANADRALKLVKDTGATVTGAVHDAADAAIDTSAELLGRTGKGARKVVGDTLGLPAWLIPVAAVGIGFVVLRALVPTLPGILTSRYAARR